jgi:hypothetical protein
MAVLFFWTDQNNYKFCNAASEKNTEQFYYKMLTTASADSDTSAGSARSDWQMFGFNILGSQRRDAAARGTAPCAPFCRYAAVGRVPAAVARGPQSRRAERESATEGKPAAFAT